MKRTKYSIRRNSIPSLALKDRTSKVWIDDSNGNDVPWSGITSGTPISGTVIYNTTTGGTDNLIAGYHSWDGTFWTLKVGAPITNLTNLTNRNPLDETNHLITGSVLFNSGTTNKLGYYEWGIPNGGIWNYFTKTSGNTFNLIRETLNHKIYPNHQIPLYLESKADEMGHMVDFDGDIGQNTIC